MSIDITCNRCGASMAGSVAEVIQWDKTHEEFCPNPQEEKS